MPLNADCYIQSPHEEFIKAIIGINYVQDEIYIKIKLTEENKTILLRITVESLEEYIQSAKIKYNGELLFEAYDGFEYGILSKRFNIENSILKEIVVQGNCTISKEW